MSDDILAEYVPKKRRGLNIGGGVDFLGDYWNIFDDVMEKTENRQEDRRNYREFKRSQISVESILTSKDGRVNIVKIQKTMDDDYIRKFIDQAIENFDSMSDDYPDKDKEEIEIRPDPYFNRCPDCGLTFNSKDQKHIPAMCFNCGGENLERLQISEIFK